MWEGEERGRARESRSRKALFNYAQVQRFVVIKWVPAINERAAVPLALAGEGLLWMKSNRRFITGRPFLAMHLPRGSRIAPRIVPRRSEERNETISLALFLGTWAFFSFFWTFGPFRWKNCHLFERRGTIKRKQLFCILLLLVNYA